MKTDDYLTKWSKNHKKGILKYWAGNALPLLLTSMLSMLLFSYLNDAIDRVYLLLKYNIFFNLFFNLLILGAWFISEKKYERENSQNSLD